VLETIEKDPLVSVIIPVFNCQQYVAEAIESILAQTYENREIIVVDDGSTDGTAQAVAPYLPHIRYVLKENGGVASALNAGVEQSKGSILAFLDADDTWIPQKLDIQFDALQKDASLEAVFGHVRQFKSPELDEASRQKIEIPQEVLPGRFKGTFFIKRESFFRVGLFNEDWAIGDFIDWYARAMENDLKSIMLPDILMMRRLHKSNIGRKTQHQRPEFARILKASLDRRRQRA